MFPLSFALTIFVSILLLAVANLIKNLQETEKEFEEAEEDYPDAPEEYLDPIMQTIMRDPVMLPASKQVHPLNIHHLTKETISNAAEKELLASSS
tara:strand:+ start:81 stop:365 length:285 start_codon:yes stop_codon:yes gene_type:complete